MEKFKVSFEASNQQLKALGTKHASDTYADIEATFVLGERWTDMDSVSAVWWNDFTRVATVLDSQGKCIVPHEVLTRKGCVRVNLVGSIVEGDELITRLTSYSAEAVQVNEKIKLTGSETSELTPSQFEQFVAVVISEVEKVTGMTAQAETLPAGSQATARYENGILYLGIPQGIQGERGETGQDGADGNGIASVVYNADYTLTLVFDNGETFTTPPIRGERGERGEAGQDGADGRDGADGVTPNLTIGTVETLAPTEDATATITGTAENPVLNLGLTKGDTGEVSLEDLGALLPTDTASGDIVTIPDGQSVIPAESLKVALEPIQDLHGYDKPWVGGAGANILDLEAYIESRTDDYSVDADGWITINNLGQAGLYVNHWSVGDLATRSAMILIDSSRTTATNVQIRVYDGTTVVTQTTDKLENRQFDSIGFNWSDNGSVTVKVAVVNATTISTWTPYSNICPISGWTDVVTHRTGVNVWDEEWEVGAYLSNGTKTAVTDRIRCKNPIPILPNTAYYLMCGITMFTTLVYLDIDGNPLDNQLHQMNSGNTFTTLSGAYYLLFYGNGAYGATYNHDISINYPSTDTEYHAYDGETYTTALGQTVYGGTLDVVSGELVVDKAIVTLNGSSTWVTQDTLTNTKHYSHDINDITASTGVYSDDVIGDSMPTIASNVDSVHMNHRNVAIHVWIPKGITPSTYFADNPLQVCYPLATPQTIQLTPQEVKLLLGTNNIWSDGNVTLVYSADIQKWVEKKLNGNSTTLTMSRPMTAELNETETETTETEETE